LPRCLIMMLLMSAVIHLLGASWLAVHVGPGRALGAGVLPFVPGDLLKAATAAVAVRATEGARSLLRR
ncbi:biotin transporter BioY, partial [Candidatus Fermentibacterales bacterium]|nr:biotin transporter BioY [Candidatus Fermentibacterales bacterium]